MIEVWKTAPAEPATDADRAAIEATVDDYYEAWYSADAARMQRAVHPALAKRAYAQAADRAPKIADTTADDMIEAIAGGRGRTRAGAPGSTRVRIDDVSGDMASVTVWAEHYFYLHLIRTPEGWRIINALWRWADGHGPRA